MAFLVALLSVSLVVVTPQTAQALNPPTVNPTVGGVIRNLPDGSTVATAAGTAARANPWVRGAGVFLAGLAVVDASIKMWGGEDGVPDPTKGADPLEDNGPDGKVYGFEIARPCLATYQVTVRVNTAGGQDVSGVASVTGCPYQTNTYYRMYCQNSVGGVAYQQGASLIRNGTSQLWFGSCGAGSEAFRLNIYNTHSSSQLTADRMVGTVQFTDFSAAQHETTTTVDCRKPDGSVVQITETWTARPNELLVPSCEQRVPGSTPHKISQWSGKTGLDKSLDYEHQVKDDVYTEFPNCFGPGGLQCVTTVWINGRPCSADRAICADWLQAINDGEVTGSCRFGEYVIPMGNCMPLRHAFRPGVRPREVKETTRTGDPKYEENPSNQPTAGVGIPLNGSNPSAPPVDPENPEVDPDSHNCLQDAWGWNPVDWVYVPVKCAFIWAFVPKNLPRFTDIGSPLPSGWLPTFPTFSDAACGRITMPRLAMGANWFPKVGPYELIDTCTGHWPTVRVLTYYGLLAGVLVGVGNRTLRAAMTALGMGVDTPTGGGDD